MEGGPEAGACIQETEDVLKERPEASGKGLWEKPVPQASRAALVTS